MTFSILVISSLILVANVTASECENPQISDDIFDSTLFTDHNLVIDSFRNRCDLLGEFSKEFNSSEMWAQQMTGADLVRKELESNEIPIELLLRDVQVWDVEPFHAEIVSNLIAGPHPSALIPNEFAPPHVKHRAGFAATFTDRLRPCIESQENCPQFINHSDDWKGDHSDGSDIGAVFSQLNGRGTISIVSSGNDTGNIEEAKNQYAETILLVGAASSNAQPKSWSSQSEHVVITAPGDRLRSYDFQGVEDSFGATSAAAPQVLSALLMFNKVSGHHLSLSEAKHLLKQTALPFTNLREGERHGAGILNAYKLYSLAKKLKRLCQGSVDSCAETNINSTQFYVNEPENSEELFSQTLELFPECQSEVQDHKVVQSGQSCEAQRRVFNEVRKLSLLDHTNTRAWNLLSCMTSLSPYIKNHEYYSSMSSDGAPPALEEVENTEPFTLTLSREDYVNSIRELLAREDYTIDEITELARKSPSPLPTIHIDLFKAASKFELGYSEMNYFKLEDPIFSERPDIINDLIARNSDDIDEYLVYTVIRRSHWSDEQFIGWSNLILDRRSDDEMIDSDIFNNGYLVRESKDSSLLERFFSEGNIDGELASSLPFAYWTSHPEKLNLLIERGRANGEIIRNIIPLLPKLEREKVIKQLSNNLGVNEASELSRFIHYAPVP